MIGQSIGTTIGVKVINSNNRGSNTRDKIDVKQDATGGTEVTSGGYKYHTFTSSGNFVLSATKNIDLRKWLLVVVQGRYG